VDLTNISVSLMAPAAGHDGRDGIHRPVRGRYGPTALALLAPPRSSGAAHNTSSRVSRCCWSRPPSPVPGWTFSVGQGLGSGNRADFGIAGRALRLIRQRDPSRVQRARPRRLACVRGKQRPHPRLDAPAWDDDRARGTRVESRSLATARCVSLGRRGSDLVVVQLGRLAATAGAPPSAQNSRSARPPRRDARSPVKAGASRLPPCGGRAYRERMGKRRTTMACERPESAQWGGA